MRFIAPILLSILSYASLGATAAHPEDSFEEKFAQVKRTSEEWERRVQTQGAKALDSIQEAAFHKLRSAWASYISSQVAMGQLQQEAAPSPDVLVQVFLRTCPTHSLPNFITGVCTEWSSILQRHSQLETERARREAEAAFRGSPSKLGDGRKRSPSTGPSNTSSPTK
jgi:hypothetical protein